MEESRPLSPNPSSFQPNRLEPEKLEHAAILARTRAIAARQLASSQMSQLLYETGGWQSLFEQYRSPSSNSSNASESIETIDKPLANPVMLVPAPAPEDFRSRSSQSGSNASQDESRKQVADSASRTLCPSGRPEMGDSVVFGVVEGTAEAPRIAYLTESVPVTEENLALSGSVNPTEIFRMASPCMANGCKHFDGHACRLAERIVEQLPTVVEALPDCQIRPHCRWWQQEGAAACFRCPQMVTENYHSSEIMQHVATPR